jgi:carbonic anhydrase
LAEQSTVDSPANAPVRSSGIRWAHRTSPGRVVDDGYFLRIDLAGGGIELEGSAYDIVQLHSHAPAEHTIDGKRAALELHLVHSDPAGRLAVVGIFVEEGTRHEGLQRILDAEQDIGLDPGDLLPQDRRYYAYPGSLTTPPYPEGVSWRVLRQPIEASSEQVVGLRKIHDGNVRPLQPLDGRLGS